MGKNIKIGIFTTSFLLLFLELALIRYLPSRVVYLGYYSNFILLASFAGMGAGMLLPKEKYQATGVFPWILFATIALSTIFSISVYPTSSGDIHFTSSLTNVVIPELIAIPFIFILVSVTMACLAQRLGILFDHLAPLSAYTWDILGSLCGILLFTLFSYLQLGPVIWFSCFAIVYLLNAGRLSGQTIRDLIAFIFLLMVLMPAALAKDQRWSPYQEVEWGHQSNGADSGYSIRVNNIGHQFIPDNLDMADPIYFTPYNFFKDPKYDSVLIIGAGTGTDTAIALKNHVKHVDAVEIDPVLLSLGSEINPHKPYQDSRVSVYVDDARSFLSKTDNKYDLIIFALPDSLILSSGRGNLRLESFLFTKESFESAKLHLNPNGLMVLYNYYRRPWLVAKLSGMLAEVFRETPYVTTWKNRNQLAVLMIGNKLSNLLPQAPASNKIISPPSPATDDWPFVYLYEPSIPWTYILMFVVVGLFVYFSLSRIVEQKFLKIEPSYFFLGAAFMLLETESLMRFSLLFGTTWIVNSLVFFAILSLVFVAIQLSARLKTSSMLFWYICLGLSLFAQYIYPLQNLLVLSYAPRYLAVSVLTLLPVFFANLIFSLTFKQSETNAYNFASNLLGAAAGGILEYFALITGYRNIVLLIIFIYFLAFIWPSLAEGRVRKSFDMMRLKNL